MKGKIWRLLGEYDSETTAYTKLAGPAGSSPFTPDFNGKLVGLRTIQNRSAATSLIDHVQFRLTCASFNPNTIEVGAQGNGIQTALIPQAPPMDWEIDQPVIAGVPITLEGKNNTIDTPVSVTVMLYGMFEVN